MAFDATKTKLSEEDGAPAPGMDVAAFRAQLEQLLASNREQRRELTKQAQRRLERLKAKEKRVLRRVRQTSELIALELATPKDEERHYLNARRLRDVRLDIVDTSDAMTMISVEGDRPSFRSWTPDGAVTVDDREHG